MPGTGVMEALVAVGSWAAWFGSWMWETNKENAIAGVLNKALGKYVQNLDAKKLGADFLKGKIDLPDIQLKTTALYELG